MNIQKINAINGFTLALRFAYNVATVEKCRALKEDIGWQNFQWNADIKAWLFNISSLEHVIRAFTPVEVPEEVLRELQVKKAQEQALIDSKKTAIKTSLPLFEYQKTGTNFAIAVKKGMINDDMGLGKSLQSIAAFYHLNLKRILIICPNSIKTNWQREISKWINRPSNIIEDGLYDGINIINYERLLKFSEPAKNGKHKKELKISMCKDFLNFKWDMIICDESHYIKNSNSKRTVLVHSLTENCERVLLLTGTPILNRPSELIPQLKAIGKLEVFAKDEWKFKFSFCGPKRNDYGWDFSGASNINELAEKMKTVSIRRLKQEVLHDLPDKLIHNTVLDLPEPKAYKKIADEVKKEIIALDEQYALFYKGLKNLSETERAERLLAKMLNPDNQKKVAETLVMIEKLKQETARQKVIASEDIISEYIENRRKLIIFTVHKKIAYDLQKKYGSAVVVTGDIKPADRMKAIDLFQEDPNILLFIATMKTAGVGYNLTAASEVLFMELGWTPAEMKQCEDRAWRIGQKSKVNINYLLMEGTIDEDIVEILQNKSKVIEGAVEGQLLNSVVLNFLARQK